MVLGGEPGLYLLVLFFFKSKTPQMLGKEVGVKRFMLATVGWVWEPIVGSR